MLYNSMSVTFAKKKNKKKLLLYYWKELYIED